MGSNYGFSYKTASLSSFCSSLFSYSYFSSLAVRNLTSIILVLLTYLINPPASKYSPVTASVATIIPLPCQYFNTLLGHQLLGGCPSPSAMVLIHVLGSCPTGILSLHCWGSDIFYQATPYSPSPHLDSLWPMTHVDLLPSTTINPCYVSFWLGLRCFQTIDSICCSILIQVLHNLFLRSALFFQPIICFINQGSIAFSAMALKEALTWHCFFSQMD